MPYVEEEDRVKVDNGYLIETPGQLAYKFFGLIRDYKANKGATYATMAVIAGVLILTLFEFVRQVVNPYEDFKITKNGGLKW